MRNQKNQENGFALVVVLMVSSLCFIILLSALTPFIQHRQILDYRLGQLQADQLVKNGIVYLQELSSYETIDHSTQYIETYPTGRFILNITLLNQERIQAIIIGESHKGYRQTYDVILNRMTHQVIYYVKRGGG